MLNKLRKMLAQLLVGGAKTATAATPQLVALRSAVDDTRELSVGDFSINGIRVTVVTEGGDESDEMVLPAFEGRMSISAAYIDPNNLVVKVHATTFSPTNDSGISAMESLGKDDASLRAVMASAFQSAVYAVLAKRNADLVFVQNGEDSKYPN